MGACGFGKRVFRMGKDMAATTYKQTPGLGRRRGGYTLSKPGVNAGRFLDQAHEQLGWPSRDDVLSPSGNGAELTAKLASEKLGGAISRRSDGEGINVGILAADPDATTPPIAIVCEFPKKVSDATLKETQRLAWNFCHTRLLITIEPHIVRKWTCCEPPQSSDASTLLPTGPEIEPCIDLVRQAPLSLSDQAAASLHWVELVSGRFFQEHEHRFKADRRADQMLLRNLTEMRAGLRQGGLDDDISHDLLARVIFIQFLFHRKDAEGKAALDAAELRRLHDDGVLTGCYASFGQILSSYEDTYALFRWLNGKFNGDLFPGKGSAEEQEAAWAEERHRVKADHLALLARFVSGKERMKDEQRSLWPFYAFDAIPLEFISTIYEQFVRKEAGTGIHYTPSHVVDLMLDSVLPWNGKEWNLKILDPACGSGVFLVKAFQRIIHRWKTAHPHQRITGDVLAGLLEHNLFGVDKDPHAVRVASFSLYLAMCDEIDPRDYWKNVCFPVLRGVRLIADDFFSEGYDGFNTTAAGSSYDLVIGNPPWGKNTARANSPAHEWGEHHKWPVSYGDLGPLFLAKALALTKANGHVALVQPASTLLYNSTSAARELRGRVFGEFRVEEVINLAALRRVLFRDAILPACAIVVRNAPSDGEPFWYSCPKPLHTHEDRYRVVIEPNDVHRVYPDEVASMPWIWATLLWGSRRDLAFVNRLSHYPNLALLEREGKVTCRDGIIRSNSDYVEYTELLNRPILEARDFPADDSLFLDAMRIDRNSNPRVYSKDSNDFSAFDLPQLLVKQCMMKSEQRFRAALVKSDQERGGVIFTNSFASIHLACDDQAILDTLCLVFNSAAALYYLRLTSGRFAMDRNEVQLENIRSVPLPECREGILAGVDSIRHVDERVREEFDFKEADWILIEDLARYTLPDGYGGADSPGRQPTRRRTTHEVEPDLTAYSRVLQRVLHAGFGKDKQVGVVVLSEPDPRKLPVRMVSVYLNAPDVPSVRVEAMDALLLHERLTKLYLSLLDTRNREKFYQRTVRMYDTQCFGNETGITVSLIKPDQVRYWTRSMAMRDADEIAADFMLWQNAQKEQPVDQKVTSG